MGTPGVSQEITRELLEQAIIKHKGVMKHVCAELKVGTTCGYRHLNKYPELKPILEEYRAALREDDLDHAEDALRYAMRDCKETDLTNALKASMFFLNNRGKDRGYAAPQMIAKDLEKQEIAQIDGTSKDLVNGNK